MDLHRWDCKACGYPQRTIEWPEHQFCDRCDQFTHLPCAVCGERSNITPADLFQTQRLKAVHGRCVLIDNESGDSYADVQSLRSRVDCVADRELAGAGSGRAQRDSDGGGGPVAGVGLDDDAADSDSGARGLERREPGEARGDLSGAEVALTAKGGTIAVEDRVEIIDGDGRGTQGDVVEIRQTLFGHVHVTLQTDDGTLATTLEDKIAPV